MLEFLYSWKTWLMVAVVIILLIWIYCKFSYKEPYERRHKKRDKRRPRSSREHTASCEEVSEYSYSETSSDSSSESVRPRRTLKFPKKIIEIPEEEDDVSFSNTLSSRWRGNIPQEILDPRRPESVRKMTEKETKGERLCKEAAEKIYGVTFHRSVWPDWLRNPKTGRAMELDLYNEDLEIAIEYNGRQHYQYVPHFHKNGKKDFEAQVQRDHDKLDICDDRGVYVITVPYYLPEDKIEEWIRYHDPSATALREARKNQL